MNTRYNEIDKKFNSLIEKAKRKIDFESGINKSIIIIILIFILFI